MSWFKNKPRPVAAPPAAGSPAPAPASPSPAGPSAAAAELIRRWDASIADNRARVQALIDEAVAGSTPLVETIGTDLTQLVLPWNTLRPRVLHARDELADLWSRISDEMSASGAFTHEMIRREGSKRDLAGLELELVHDRAYGGVMARAAERMRAAALSTDAGAHACVRCGAMLDKVTPVSQSLNVECAYCKAINTVHPGNALRMFAASGAAFLANEEAREAGETMKRIEIQLKQFRDAQDVPLQMLIELEAASRSYWTTKLNAEARYTPEEAGYVPGKLDRHMQDVQRTLRRYWQWRSHEAAARSPSTC